MRLVKFIDQCVQGRYFMPKIEVNSVDYNSLIGADFKNVASSNRGAKHHIPIYIAVALALIGILIVSVVLAHSNQTTPAISNLTSIANVSALTAPDLQTNNNQQSIELKLKPVTEQSQSQTLALRVETEAAIQETISGNDLETIAITESIVEESDVTVVVKKGDTLSSIFSDLDIHQELTRILNLGKQAKPFKKIYPGQKLHFTFGSDGINKLELEKKTVLNLCSYIEIMKHSLLKNLIVN